MNKSIWLAVLLAWLSWFFTTQSANARETRKEYLAIASSLQDLCKELEEMVLGLKKTNPICDSDRIRLHRALARIESMLDFERKITGKDISSPHFYRASMYLSEIIDHNDSSLSDDERDSKLDGFFVEMTKLSTSVHSSFIDRYYIKEIVWWEDTMQYITISLVKFIKILILKGAQYKLNIVELFKKRS